MRDSKELSEMLAYDAVEPHGFVLADMVQAAVRLEMRKLWASKDRSEFDDLRFDISLE